MKKTLNWLLPALMTLLFLPQPTWGQSPGTVRKNYEAIDLYKQEQFYESYKLFTESLADEPFHPLLHLNLGMSYIANEEQDKALKAFRSAKTMAEQSQNRDFLYFALFDLGTAQAMTGDVENALQNFQKGLALKPGDKDIRENIEKMWQAQQGEGQGDSESNDPNQEQNDGEGEQQEDEQRQDGQGDEQQKKKPKPFDSQELTKDDVRKILEEIKNQEQKIRAEVYEGKSKSKPREKDW